jgi:hypothetical protein
MENEQSQFHSESGSWYKVTFKVILTSYQYDEIKWQNPFTFLGWGKDCCLTPSENICSDIHDSTNTHQSDNRNTGNSSINLSVSIKRVLLHDISNKYTLLIKNEQLCWFLTIQVIYWLD